MTEGATMTAERFAALADAYGARLHRWPAADRAAAAAFAQTQEGLVILRCADDLDAALDCYVAPMPSPVLQARILRDATKKSHADGACAWKSASPESVSLA